MVISSIITRDFGFVERILQNWDNFFKQCPLLFWPEVWVRETWDKHLQVTPGQVRTGMHDNVWTSSALLLLEPRNRIPTQGTQLLSLQNGLPWGGSRVRANGKATKLSIFELLFSWFSIYLVAVSLWLFSGVLTKLVLTVSAWFFFFLVFLWWNTSLQLTHSTNLLISLPSSIVESDCFYFYPPVAQGPGLYSQNPLWPNPWTGAWRQLIVE